MYNYYGNIYFIITSLASINCSDENRYNIIMWNENMCDILLENDIIPIIIIMETYSGCIKDAIDSITGAPSSLMSLNLSAEMDW